MKKILIFIAIMIAVVVQAKAQATFVLSDGRIEVNGERHETNNIYRYYQATTEYAQLLDPQMNIKEKYTLIGKPDIENNVATWLINGGLIRIDFNNWNICVYNGINKKIKVWAWIDKGKTRQYDKEHSN